MVGSAIAFLLKYPRDTSSGVPPTCSADMKLRGHTQRCLLPCLHHLPVDRIILVKMSLLQFFTAHSLLQFRVMRMT